MRGRVDLPRWLVDVYGKLVGIDIPVPYILRERIEEFIDFEENEEHVLFRLVIYLFLYMAMHEFCSTIMFRRMCATVTSWFSVEATQIWRSFPKSQFGLHRQSLHNDWVLK